MALLKRHPDSTPHGFRTHYITRHAPLAIPWCLANGATYYAQIYPPLRWASEDLRKQFAGVDLTEWDAAAEMIFPPGRSGESSRESGIGMEYSRKVIVPDEKRFLFSEATEHMMVVGLGSVRGERIEFIVDGKATVEYGEWQKLWHEYLSRGKE